MAEFLLRRCANAYPEYLYARLNLGSLFMDRLSVEVLLPPACSWDYSVCFAKQ